MKKRMVLIYGIILFSFTFLIARLYGIVLNNPASEVLSGQYSRKQLIATKSGLIYDTNLKPLSFENDEFITVINPTNLDTTINKAAEMLLNISYYSFSELISKFEQNTIFTIFTTTNLHSKWAESFNFYKDNNSDFARHIIGYCENKEDSLAIRSFYSDFFDKTEGSISLLYTSNAAKSILKGTDYQIIDNNFTNTDGLVLSIDKELQKKCESISNNLLNSGTILVTNSQNGDILANVSRPVYDILNLDEFIDSNNGEFLNRAFVAYPQGSVFKTVVCAAALENDIEKFNFKFECKGSIEVEGRTFKCHKKEGHGKITMKDAFAGSCNCYFIELGNIIGYDMIIEMAKRFGIGNEIMVDKIPVDSGNLPNEKYPTAQLCANIALGQGEILTTPLESINIINAASTGKITDFHIVKGFYENGKLQTPKRKKSTRVLDNVIVEKLKILLQSCVEDGTGQRARVKNVKIGGKTGTAQTGIFNSNNSEISHLWFVGTFPLENPKYTIAILYDELTDKRNFGVPQDIFFEICKYLMQN